MKKLGSRTRQLTRGWLRLVGDRTYPRANGGPGYSPGQGGGGRTAGRPASGLLASSQSLSGVQDTHGHRGLGPSAGFLSRCRWSVGLPSAALRGAATLSQERDIWLPRRLQSGHPGWRRDRGESGQCWRSHRVPPQRTEWYTPPSSGLVRSSRDLRTAHGVWLAPFSAFKTHTLLFLKPDAREQIPHRHGRPCVCLSTSIVLLARFQDKFKHLVRIIRHPS